MSDLLAKCDWNGDELHVELPQWPEVMTVWVNGKAMPFAPVTTDLAEEIRSKVEAWSEVAELQGTIECLKGLAEANYERCDTCEAMLDCDECVRADASHKELRGLQTEIKALKERVAELEELTDGKRYIPQEWYQLATTENADLRELVRDMWRFTGTACKKYPRLFDQSAQGGQMVIPNMLDSFEQRMAELGIEVE